MGRQPKVFDLRDDVEASNPVDGGGCCVCAR